MATRSLTVVAQVKDAASAALKKIADSFDNTNKAVRKSSVDFTEFNRVLFSTAAFIGIFSKAFDKLVGSLNQSAELDRVSEQFERVMGPRGNLFQAINGMTKNSIDRMEAMRSGISLGTLGIVKDTKQLAEIIARSGTAAKRAGFQSGEGIKRVTDFLKTGEISNLAFLNVLSATNPALQAQMAILHRAGGVMGTVISTQAKLSMGMAALRAATQGMNNDNRDLMDIMADVSQSFSFLKGEIGSFLGKALGPIIDKVKDFNFAATDLVERIKKADSTLILTVKNLFLVGSALTSVIATLGTARLFFKALGALGIGGIPFVVTALLGLAAAFTDVEKATASFTNMAKSVGAVLLGTFQLVSSFIQDSDNFSKGIGKMDGELHAFLQKQGLLELTKNIARVSAVVITFVKDVGNTLVNWFKIAADAVDPLIKKISEFFGKSDPKGWARSWIEGGKGVRGILINLTAAAMTAFAAFKVLSIGKGLLSKIPIIGSLFGGGNQHNGRKGPSGTSGDPIYTKEVGSFIGPQQKFTLLEKLFGKNSKLFPTFTKFGQVIKNFGTKVGAGVFAGAEGGILSTLFTPLVKVFTGIMDPLIGGVETAFGLLTKALNPTELFARLVGVEQWFIGLLRGVGTAFSAVIEMITNPVAAFRALFTEALPFLSSFASGLGTVVGIIGRFSLILLAAMGAVGAIKGIFEGLSETGGGFINFFKSIGNLTGAVYEAVSNFVKVNPIIQGLYTSLKNSAMMILKLPKEIFDMIVEGWKQIAGWLGIAADFIGDKINNLATRLNMNTADSIRDQLGGAAQASVNTSGVQTAAPFADKFGLNNNVPSILSPAAQDLAALGLATNDQGKTGVAYVPKMPETEADKDALVQEAISRLSGFEQVKMQEAFKMATKDGVITPEEWKDIFKDGLDESKLTKHAEKQANKPEKPAHINTKRC